MVLVCVTNRHAKLDDSIARLQLRQRNFMAELHRLQQ